VGFGFVPPANMVEWWIGVAMFFLFLAIKIFALVTSLLYSAESYVAADKRNKVTWTSFLAASVVVQVIPLGGFGMTIIDMGLLIASCVFLADVRPALASLKRR
jgi:hypothetical protein